MVDGIVTGKVAVTHSRTRYGLRQGDQILHTKIQGLSFQGSDTKDGLKCQKACLKLMSTVNNIVLTLSQILK